MTAAATDAPLQQQIRPRHFRAQFFASTARNTATSLTVCSAVGSWLTGAAPSSTSIAAYAVPLVRGSAPLDIMRPAQAGGALVVALATGNPQPEAEQRVTSAGRLSHRRAPRP